MTDDDERDIALMRVGYLVGTQELVEILAQMTRQCDPKSCETCGSEYWLQCKGAMSVTSYIHKRAMAQAKDWGIEEFSSADDHPAPKSMQ